ncbi:MAG: ATP-binding cassette, subfamily multidrug efflux pump [Blastocatellia bacterium]|jgi:ATP-binding cassette subfamily B protein|nr:ATP-binding cassette, subfamily multidrug efflux pump [Blastocatellia bacterium]
MSEIPYPDKAIGKIYQKRVLRWLLRYLLPYKHYVCGALLLTALSAPLILAGPPLMKAAVDLFLAPDPAKPVTGFALLLRQSAEALGYGGSAYRGVAFIALVFLMANLLGIVVQYLQSIVLQSMGQHIMYDLRQDIFAHLQKIPLRFYDRNPIGRLMTRLTTDVDTLNELFTSSLITILGDFAMALFIVTYMLRSNWRLALVSFCILPLLVILTAWFRRGSRAAIREVRLQVGQLNAFLQEHITGMAIVQLFNAEEKDLHKFERINRSHRKANEDSVFYFAIFNPAVEMIGTTGVALILWYGGGQVSRDLATLGTMIAFIQLAKAFYQPISDIGDKYNTIQSALTSSERIYALLDEPVTIESQADSLPRERARGRIEFCHVWFAYDNEDWVLKDVSFVIEPGERIAIVGHTGAGKTTLTNLLLRFYDIQRGQILLDGIDIRELGLDHLRSNFSIVMQDVFLFSGDIASNIRLGHNSISDEKLRQAARHVHAEDFIRKLPAGYLTQVQERGAGLSSGQKQLISFARALAFDPRILILDEATSSIDTETEILISDAVGRLIKGRTSLVIAHRLSTIQSVDKIIVMHKGEVREFGTHLELLRLRGLYWRLLRLQFYKDSKFALAESVAPDSSLMHAA